MSRATCPSCGSKISRKTGLCPKCGTAPATQQQDQPEEEAYRLADAEPPARPAKASKTPKVSKEPEGIKFVCAFCDETYQVSKDLAGKVIRCRNCGELDRV
jgi:hypothetical protein